MTVKPNENTDQIDYGTRSISKQNFSKIICLPREALKICGLKDSKRAQISLVITDKENYIKISPCTDDLEKNLKYSSNRHEFSTFNTNYNPGDNNKND